MRAHGKGSEGSEKRGGGAKIKRGCEKKGGARSTGTPPVYAPVELHLIVFDENCISFNMTVYNLVRMKGV